MSTITLETSVIKAHLSHAAKHDVRFYLNGIYFEPQNGLLVSTDGHRMLVSRHVKAFENCETLAPVILCRDSLELAIKATPKKMPMFIDVENGVYKTATVTIKQLDGKFPDWRRVVPTTATGEVVCINTRYIDDAAAALQLLANGKASDERTATIHYNGNGSALVTGSSIDAFAVIMPMHVYVNSSEYALGLASNITGASSLQAAA